MIQNDIESLTFYPEYVPPNISDKSTLAGKSIEETQEEKEEDEDTHVNIFANCEETSEGKV